MINATNTPYRPQVRIARKSGFRPISWWASQTNAQDDERSEVAARDDRAERQRQAQERLRIPRLPLPAVPPLPADPEDHPPKAHSARTKPTM
jgi:hypothetical protein